jgi:hypothetical protein
VRGRVCGFDVGSPLTGSIGLGIFEEVSAASLAVMERFFWDRGAPLSGNGRRCAWLKLRTRAPFKRFESEIAGRVPSAFHGAGRTFRSSAAKNMVAIEAIAVYYSKPGRQNGNPASWQIELVEARVQLAAAGAAAARRRVSGPGTNRVTFVTVCVSPEIGTTSGYNVKLFGAAGLTDA